MNKRIVIVMTTVVALSAAGIIAWQLFSNVPARYTDTSTHYHGAHGADEHVEEGPLPIGPHGGVLIADRDLAIELVKQPGDEQQWWRVYYFGEQQQSLLAGDVQMSLTLHNNELGQSQVLTVDSAEGPILVGPLPKTLEPGWQLNMVAQHGGHAHQWQLLNLQKL